MSFQAMADAIKIKTKKSNEKLMLLALANYADENYQSYPSIATLAADCCMSESTVKATLKRLVDQNLVDIESRLLNDNRSTSNLYTLLLENADRVVKGKSKKPPEKNPTMGGRNSPPHKNRPTAPITMGGQNLPPHGYGGAKSDPMGAKSDPPSEPINKPSSSSKRDQVSEAEREFDFDAAFAFVLGLMSNEFKGRDLPEGLIKAIWQDYVDGATSPSKGRAYSFVLAGIQQHMATQRRSMAVSHSRDELTSARIRHISAQKTLADRKAAELEPKDRFDTSWADGLEILEQAE